MPLITHRIELERRDERGPFLDQFPKEPEEKLAIVEPNRIISKGSMRPSAFKEIQSEIRDVLLEEFASPNGIGEIWDDTPGCGDGRKMDL